MKISDTLIESLPIPGLLADGILMLHAGIVMFVVVGQILIVVGWWQNWHWVRSFWLRFLHLITIVIVMVQSWLGQMCPLTIWEQQLRAAAGKAVHDESLVEFWLSRVLFLRTTLKCNLCPRSN